MLLITISLSAQSGFGGAYDYFSGAPAYQRMLLYSSDVPQMMRKLQDTYAFSHTLNCEIKNFMLSYDDYSGMDINTGGKAKTRYLYIYRFDYADYWKKASNPIHTDYVKEDGSYCYYYPRLDKGGKVEVLPNGIIRITLTLISSASSAAIETFTTEVILIKSNGTDGTFKLLPDATEIN